MRVKHSYSKALCQVGIMGLASFSLTSCSSETRAEWWRDIMAEREPQQVDVNRRRPMLNTQFDKNRQPQQPQTNDQGYYVPQESAPTSAAPMHHSGERIGSLHSAPPQGYTGQTEPGPIESIGSWFSDEESPPTTYNPSAQPAYSPGPASATTTAEPTTTLAAVPSKIQRKPIASNPDAQSVGSEILLASINHSEPNPEYPALSSIPPTPGQFETVRQQHPAVKQELMQGKQQSDITRQEVHQQIADESGEALSEAFSQHAHQAPVEETQPVTLERDPLPVPQPAQSTAATAAPTPPVAAQPAPAITPAPEPQQTYVEPTAPSVEYGGSELTASVDEILIPPQITQAPPLQAAPVEVQPTVTAAAPVNAFVTQPATIDYSTTYYDDDTYYVDEADQYQPVVPQYRYAPTYPSRGSGYLPDSRY